MPHPMAEKDISSRGRMSEAAIPENSNPILMPVERESKSEEACT